MCRIDFTLEFHDGRLSSLVKTAGFTLTSTLKIEYFFDVLTLVNYCEIFAESTRTYYLQGCFLEM